MISTVSNNLIIFGYNNDSIFSYKVLTIGRSMQISVPQKFFVDISINWLNFRTPFCHLKFTMILKTFILLLSSFRYLFVQSFSLANAFDHAISQILRQLLENYLNKTVKPATTCSRLQTCIKTDHV